MNTATNKTTNDGVAIKGGDQEEPVAEDEKHKANKEGRTEDAGIGQEGGKRRQEQSNEEGKDKAKEDGGAKAKGDAQEESVAEDEKNKKQTKKTQKLNIIKRATYNKNNKET